MTKEEIKQICQIYDNFRSERDAATITYNSDNAFWEHVLATYNLSHPSLPSEIDEVAEESMPEEEGFLEIDIYGGSEAVYSRGQMLAMFKAGAEWMSIHGNDIKEL